ncbi:hypothetical protein RBS60_15885 [Sinomonas sp. ASV486]|uniref:APC family permease n=1 Tax=Sinomonas sp. ASV486 TaxID=3051170 RepID=UPI0027DBBB65|nr:amino acid permease [Sinomonas sp. ASV486]MDQ4491682.1 hypothetical protein [Sinomonas sp. ASV486]
MPATSPRGLSRVAAVLLAFGSIAGSGILSLPSAVYAQTGSGCLLVWAVAALLCLPMLVMFQDAMGLSGGGDALQALVSRGLRPWVGAAMPLMFVFVVVVGLPTGCAVAGRYVERGLGWGGGGAAVAAALLVLALSANLAGARVGALVQFAGGAALVATGLILVAAGSWNAPRQLDVLPTGAIGETLLPGVLLAFWAFVGFENLTFLGRELRDPRRDFLPVSSVALGLYGAFAVALTLAVSVRADQHSVDPVAGLLELATSPALQGLVAVVAAAAMLVNAAAWVRGVNSLIAGASRDGCMPSILGASAWARTALLGALFAATLSALAADPSLTVDALAASSAVFVLIYIICIVSYVRSRGPSARTLANLALIPIMAAALVQSGTRSVYGLLVAAGCLAWCRTRSRSGRPGPS